MAAPLESWAGRRSRSPFQFLWFRTTGALAALVGPLLLLLPKAEIPSATAWDDARDPFVVVTIIVLGLAALYGIFKAIDEGKTDSAAASLERQASLAATLKTVYPIVNRTFRNVPIDEIGIHIWAVDATHGVLRRVEKSLMQGNRDELPIKWEKGTGAIGQAWERLDHVARDLTELIDAAKDPDPARFEALDDDTKLGMTREDVRRSAHYKAVLAVPLSIQPSSTAESEIVGVLSIDFGRSVNEGKLDALAHDQRFRDVRGSCEAWFLQQRT